MKAAILTAFGSPEVLELGEVATPRPRAHEVLVRVHATSVGFGDRIVRNLAAITPRKFHMPLVFWLIAKLFFGFRKPRLRVLGSEFAGRIDAIGSAVTRFKVGDLVFGYSGARMGACAEYLRVREDGIIAIKPANLDDAQAATIPYAGIMALGVLRKARVEPGHRLLVVGASGAIGSALIQLAKSVSKASEVAAVCGPSHVDFVRSLGADRAIDYTREDFCDRAESYDVIIDVLGKSSFARCRRVLRPGGRMVFVSFKARQLAQALWTSLIGDKRCVCVLVSETSEDLIELKRMIEGGHIQVRVDRSFPLDQTARAHEYVESGNSVGYVAIAVAAGGPS